MSNRNLINRLKGVSGRVLEEMPARGDADLILEAVDALERFEWASVEDRLPEETGRYLVYLPDGTVNITVFNAGSINRFFNPVPLKWLPLPPAGQE